MPRLLARRKVPAVAVLLAVAATLLPLVAGSQALAAPATPATPSFGRAIEDYANYDGQTICDPVDRPGILKLAQLIRQTYGTDEVIGTSRNACYTVSEHNDGRALDWMIDVSKKAQKAKADAFLSWLLATDKHGNKYAMARRLGIMYMIFNHRIWRAYSPRGWGPYDGVNPHTDHIHFSLSYDGASGRTSFWTGKPLAGPCATPMLTSGAPKVVTDPMRYVPVAATRLASTESGAGMVNGPCRLFTSTSYTRNRVDVPVTGVASVPSQGVAAVALQVSMRRPNWDSYLTAGPAGGTIPGVRRVSAAQNQTSSALLELPVGADGKVSFFTNFGATDLSVSVVGYYVDPNAPLRVRRAITSDGGDTFDPIAPTPVYSDVAVGASGRFKAPLAGKAGTDTASTAAVVSVTVAPGVGHGNLFVYPAGSDRPKLPLLSYDRKASTVQTVVPLGRGGSVIVENSGRAPRSVNLDLVGAYEPASLPGGHAFAALRVPKTVLDTGSGLGLAHLGAGKSKDFSVSDAVPKKTSSVLLQVTASQPKTDTSLTFWRPGKAFPGTTDMSVAAGQIVTGTFVAPVSDTGKVRVRNVSGGHMDLRVTVLGSFH